MFSEVCEVELSLGSLVWKAESFFRMPPCFPAKMFVHHAWFARFHCDFSVHFFIHPSRCFADVHVLIFFTVTNRHSAPHHVTIDMQKAAPSFISYSRPRNSCRSSRPGSSIHFHSPRQRISPTISVNCMLHVNMILLTSAENFPEPSFADSGR